VHFEFDALDLVGGELILVAPLNGGVVLDLSALHRSWNVARPKARSPLRSIRSRPRLMANPNILDVVPSLRSFALMNRPIRHY
jgi:hypothetical protein